MLTTQLCTERSILSMIRTFSRKILTLSGLSITWLMGFNISTCAILPITNMRNISLFHYAIFGKTLVRVDDYGYLGYHLSINELCGRKSSPLSCIKVSSIDQVKEKLRHHYVYFRNRPHHPSPINDDDDVVTVSPDLDPPEVTGPITTAELRAALSTSKLSSSYGPDGIPVIALRILLRILLINRRILSSQNTTFHLNGSTRLLYLLQKMGLHSL